MTSAYVPTDADLDAIAAANLLRLRTDALTRTIDRAETAEKELAALKAGVEALADDAKRLAVTYWAQDSTYTTHAQVWSDVDRRFRALLAANGAPSSPVDAPAAIEGTSGPGWSRRGW